MITATTVIVVGALALLGKLAELKASRIPVLKPVKVRRNPRVHN
jgi:hypothetical protein